MTLFELFSIVLMGIIVLIGIGVILGFILVGVIIINYFRWRHQEKKAAESGGRMGKRKYYFPPKAEKKPITVSDDVKEELKKLADKYADDAIKERQTEDLDNYIAFTLEALRRLGWTGKVRLNRFLSVLTTVSEEATNADDPPAYANQIKERFKKIGVKAFTKNDDATPQLEDHVERNDDK